MEDAPGLLARLEREVGVPGIAERLAALQGSDLQSLLLHVMRLVARRRTPADVLASYRENRFVRPAAPSPARLVEWERVLLACLPPEFEALELSPVAPLATNSAVAIVDQHRAVSTVRMTEVVSDPTNVLALECAERRRALLATPNAPITPVHLAARHRVVRPQHFSGPRSFAHFSLFCLCSAGRARGDAFEFDAIVTHVRFYISALRASIGNTRQLTVRISDFAPDPRRMPRVEQLLIAIAQDLVNVTCERDDLRTQARGYYRGLCFKIYAADAGGAASSIELADGGSVDWAEKLLSDTHEALFISGIASERVCTL